MKRKRRAYAKQGLKCGLAAELCRSEDVKRSHNYRRHVKHDLSAARRRLDQGIIEEELDMEEENS